MSHMIELHRVSKFYTNKDAVSTGFSRIDLALDMGEFVAITGESGSGKSTLLNVISGLDSYEEGEMFVGGEDTSGFRTEDYERYRKTYIGNIFQDYNLVNSYTVYQNIELSMLLAGKSKEERKARIKEFIELVDLTEYTKTKASKLSGGQKQRVAIARALAKDAPIIVADEPTGNLDSVSAQKVMETLYKISRNKLVVIVTHNYEQAEPYVTRKLTMHDGRIIEDKRIRPAAVVPEYSEYYSSSQKTPEEQQADEEVSEVYESLLQLTESEPSVLAGDELSVPETEQIQQFARRGGRAERNAAREAAEASPAAESKRARKSRSSQKATTESVLTGTRTSRGGGGSTRNERSISFGSQVRLGVRNTFNLPTKFILLFIVYVFVASSVLSQYASLKSAFHENSLLGYNMYFSDTAAERLIVTKNDGKAFTDEDYASIKALDNVDYIVKSDAGIDTGIMFESETIDISGPMYPADCLDESQLTYGRMPKSDYEVAIALDDVSFSYDYIRENGEATLGKKFYINAYTSQVLSYGDRLIPKKVEVVGIAILDSATDKEMSGNTFIYVSDKVANDILVKTAAASATVTVDYNGKKVDYSGYQVIYPSDKVPSGEVYISEDVAYSYFDEGNARTKPLSVKVKNHYYEDTGKYTISTVYKDTTIESILGMKKEQYDDVSSNIYISRKDYNKLFDKGFFQSSVYMKNEKDSDATKKALEDLDLKVLVVKDTLIDDSAAFNMIIRLFSLANTAITFIVLFFIAYAVIRLIMKSRNSYYSTLRILGANRSHTNNILRVELCLMMAISYGVVLVVSALAKRGIIEYQPLVERLEYLTAIDYIVLLIALLVMSLLIAGRYARKIFSKSAMKIYREEA